MADDDIKVGIDAVVEDVEISKALLAKLAKQVEEAIQAGSEKGTTNALNNLNKAAGSFARTTNAQANVTKANSSFVRNEGQDARLAAQKEKIKAANELAEKRKNNQKEIDLDRSSHKIKEQDNAASNRRILREEADFQKKRSRLDSVRLKRDTVKNVRQEILGRSTVSSVVSGDEEKLAKLYESIQGRLNTAKGQLTKELNKSDDKVDLRRVQALQLQIKAYESLTKEVGKYEKGLADAAKTAQRDAARAQRDAARAQRDYENGFGSRGNQRARTFRGVFSPSDSALGRKGGVARDISNVGNLLGAGASFGPAGVAAGALLGTVAKLTATYTDYIDKVRVVSAQTGVAAQESAKFVSVFDDLGINSDRAAAALFQFTKYLDEDRVAKYGIEVERLSNGNVNVIETFINLSERINQTNDAAERANITYAALGRIGATVLPVLELGPDKLRERFGNVPTVNANDLEKQRQMKLAVAALREEFIGLSVDVGRVVVPAITGITRTFSGLIDLFSSDNITSINGAIALDKIGTKLPFVGGYYEDRIRQLETAKETEERLIKEIVDQQNKGIDKLNISSGQLSRIFVSKGQDAAKSFSEQDEGDDAFSRDRAAFEQVASQNLPQAKRLLDNLQQQYKDIGFSQKEINSLTKDYVNILADAGIALAKNKLAYVTLSQVLDDPSFGFRDSTLSDLSPRSAIVSENGRAVRSYDQEIIGEAISAADKQQEAQLSVLELKEEIRLKQLEINEAETKGAAKQSDAVQKQIDALQSATKSDQASLRKISRSREDVDYQRSLIAGRKGLTDAEREYQYALEDQGTAARALAASERELEKVKRENSPEANARKEALALRELRDERYSLVDAEKDYTRAVEDRYLLDQSVNRAVEDRLELNESARRSEYDAVQGVRDAEKSLKDLYTDQAGSVEKLNEALERRNSLLGDGRFNTLEELIGPASKITTDKKAEDELKKLEEIEKAQERLKRQQYDLNKLRKIDSVRQTQDADQAILSAERARDDGIVNLDRQGTKLVDQRGDLAQKEKDTAQTIKDIPLDAQLAIESQTLEVRKGRRGVEQELLDIEDKKKAVDEQRYNLAVLKEQEDIKAINRRIEDRDLQIDILEKNKKELEDLEGKTKATKNYGAEVAVLAAQLEIATLAAAGTPLTSTEANERIRRARAKALGGNIDNFESILTGPVTSTQAYEAAIKNGQSRGRLGSATQKDISYTEAYNRIRKGKSGTFDNSGLVATFIDPVIGAGRVWLDDIYPTFLNSVKDIEEATKKLNNKEIKMSLSLEGKSKADKAVLGVLEAGAGPPTGTVPPLTTGRWKGGPMRQGDFSIVSEAGPELFRTKDGQLLSLGEGPNLFQAPADGQVLTALQSSKLLSALRNGSTSYSNASSSSVVQNSNNKSVTVRVEAPTSSARRQGRDVGREIVKAIRNL